MSQPTSESRKPWFQVALLCDDYTEADGPMRRIDLLGIANHFAAQPIAPGVPTFPIRMRLRLYLVLRNAPTVNAVIHLTLGRVRDEAIVHEEAFNQAPNTFGHTAFINREVTWRLVEPGDYKLFIGVHPDRETTDILFRVEPILGPADSA